MQQSLPIYSFLPFFMGAFYFLSNIKRLRLLDMGNILLSSFSPLPPQKKTAGERFRDSLLRHQRTRDSATHSQLNIRMRAEETQESEPASTFMSIPIMMMVRKKLKMPTISAHFKIMLLHLLIVAAIDMGT